MPVKTKGMAVGSAKIKSVGAVSEAPATDRERKITAFLRASQGASRLPNTYLVFLGMEPKPSGALIEDIEKGFDFHAFVHFQDVLGLPAKDVASLLHIPNSTLVRRREMGRLASDESERLVRLSRLFALAIQLFEGDVKAARHWMQTPKKPLNGAIPLQMATTELGAREVEKLIDRLENGVFS